MVEKKLKIKSESKQKTKPKAIKKLFWLVDVNMGYGHQRTAFPLRDYAFSQRVINANSYEGILLKDKAIWNRQRKFYELISNTYRIPIFGKILFKFFDNFQKILSFYPKRDLSFPSWQLKYIADTISKKNWGRHLIQFLQSDNRKPQAPLVSSFFTPAFMAEFFGYKGEVFCVVCDADISRAWAPLNPFFSKIKYFAPTERAAERLALYGVKKANIFLTGYPLPLDNIGARDKKILKRDMANRILNLDPNARYRKKYASLIRDKIGNLPKESNHALTLMFSIGGAGAQKEIALLAIKSLLPFINDGKLKIILSVGIKGKIKDYFNKNLKEIKVFSDGFEILFKDNIGEYFQEFNLKLRTTDILWTKPSELSFYSALGLPIIIAPTIGSQEEFNERWLLKSGFGLRQEDPSSCDQWLFDWLSQGYLAKAAMQGFVEGEQMGTLNMIDIIKIK